MSEIKMRTSDGRSLTVDSSGVDRQSLRGVPPGDTVTITGAADVSGDRFVAQLSRRVFDGGRLAGKSLALPLLGRRELCVYSEQ
jgi:hypothetical protein